MKAVNLLINSVLPEDLHDDARVYDKKGVGKLMASIAEAYPDRYNELSKFLSDTGRKASYLQGETLTLNDMKPPFDKAPYLAKMDKELAMMEGTTKNTYERTRKRMEIYAKYNDMFQDLTMKHSKGRNLMNIVASGARGNPGQMKMMVTTPGLFSDYKDNPVDLFVRNSYGEGLRPAEYLASMFGARKAVIATKGATAQAGDLGKQMTQSATRQVVTMDTCGTSNGIIMTVGEDETDLQGRVTARTIGKIPAGTVIDRHVLTELKKKKSDLPIMIRSPLTCSAQEGVCSECSGANTDGRLPPIGDAVGITATAAMAEPIAQGALNCLVEGTEVRMADFSTKEIQDLVPGDMVLGADIRGRTFPTKVTHVWDQGQQPVSEYIFKRGSTRATLSVTATEIHEILANTKKTSCKEESLNHTPRKLAIGYKAHDFGAVLPTEYINTTGESEPLALLLGLLAGDDRCPRKEIRPLGERHCWDISVEHEDSLFVLENGIIVSNTKHSGGAVAGGKRVFSGFNIIDRLLQSPSTFPDRAAVSEIAGTVSNIREAPQGGTYIDVSGPKDTFSEHYVLPGFEHMVEVGTEVEPGDQLSDGLVDIEDIVRLRGLGEGRRYYVKRLQQAYRDSGMGVSKRNLEFLARAHLDQVQIQGDEGLAGYLPDEVVSYNSLINEYQPHKDSQMLETTKAGGKYLEQPVLHFTIGTHLTPNMLKEIKSAGIPQVYTSDKEPAFSAGDGGQSMVQLRRSTKHHTDWLAKQHTSHISETLRHDAIDGADTNIEENIHFAPRLAIGIGFGDKVRETGKF